MLKNKKRKGLDATVTFSKRKVRKLNSYFLQGGRWYKVKSKVEGTFNV